MHLCWERKYLLNTVKQFKALKDSFIQVFYKHFILLILYSNDVFLQRKSSELINNKFATRWNLFICFTVKFWKTQF